MVSPSRLKILSIKHRTYQIRNLATFGIRLDTKSEFIFILICVRSGILAQDTLQSPNTKDNRTKYMLNTKFVIR